MVTGMLAVRNLVDRERHDVWSVNTDQEYHEEIREPDALGERIEGTLGAVFSRLDRVAFGTATGVLAGAALCLATVLARGGPFSDRLELLSAYFPGYEVSTIGSALALFYGSVAGFAFGWTAATLRNTLLALSLAWVHRRAEVPILRRLLDYI